MHQTQWSPERPLPPPVSLASQSHHEKPPEVTPMATHSSTVALKIPWTEELGAGYHPWGHKESGMTKQATSLSRSSRG